MAKRDVVDAVSTVLAVLAMVLQVLLALVAVIGLAALVSRRGRRALVEARETLLGSELWFAWVVAFAATAGSLFFSEYADFIPCRLCWFQRIAMYPLAVVLLVAALRRDRRAGVQYAVAFPIAGVAVAAYHIYIEQHPEAESAACRRRRALRDEVDQRVRLRDDPRALGHRVRGDPRAAGDGVVARTRTHRRGRTARPARRELEAEARQRPALRATKRATIRMSSPESMLE